ncbi:MAG: hypothetical protein AAFU55_12495, partial [Pseudomonadota bacterium]
MPDRWRPSSVSRARRPRRAILSADRPTKAHPPEPARRLGVVSLGFVRQPRLRALCAAAGWRVVPGSTACDAIGVWGRRPVSRRGLFAAKALGKPVVTIEDGFLRSVRPGPGEPLVSLIFDDFGVHYDYAAPSRLERLIEDGAGDEERAARVIDRLRSLRLSKYNAGAELASPPEGHVLLIDQKPGDASLAYGGAGPATFRRMLDAALADHPHADVIVKTHPDAQRGHFADIAHADRVRVI